MPYHLHTMNTGTVGGLTANRRRRILQIIFVFVNLALVEAHIPGPLWLVIGSAFWIALVFIALSGSSLVCGTMCWVGAIQDFAEPLARSRVRIDPHWGRGLTLAVLVLWMPIGWFVWPSAAAHDRTPLDLDPATWPHHLFGLGLALIIPLSVMLLGKRGICRFLCPFNSIVSSIRGFLGARQTVNRAKVTMTPVPTCGSGGSTCGGCTRTAQLHKHQTRG